MGYLLIQAIIVPLVTAVLCYLLSLRLGGRVGWVAFAGLAGSSIVLLIFGSADILNVSSLSESYDWAPSAGLRFGLLADGLSFPVLMIVNFVLAASAVYSMPYMEKRVGALYGETRPGRLGVYYLNFMLVATGLAGIVLSTNLVELYLFLELVLIPTFVIISLFGYVQKERVGVIYIIWNQLGAFVFLAGIALAYIATGAYGSPNSFEISDLVRAQGSTLAYWVAGLILIGWLVKMGIFGLHMWLPITEAEPPTSFAPTMAVVSGIGTYVLARVLLQGMPDTFQAFSLPLMAWAVITMFYGGAVTLAQSDVKYIFGWSTMSQNAYSILALASWIPLGVAGGVFYFMSHILGKFVMFAVAGILLTQTGLRDSKQMGGLAAKLPFTSALFILGALILSAVPPTSGFQAEWILFAGLFTNVPNGSYLAGYMILTMLGLIATLFTVAYTFWPIRRIFFGALPSSLSEVKEAPLKMTIPIFAAVVLSILIGIFPNMVTEFLRWFAASLRLGGGGS